MPALLRRKPLVASPQMPEMAHKHSPRVNAVILQLFSFFVEFVLVAMLSCLLSREWY